MDGFLAESARYFRDVHLRRIGKALEILPGGDLRWRPPRRDDDAKLSRA